MIEGIHTEQEAYEAVRAWLARDGATKCMAKLTSGHNALPTCAYADGKGNHCAIGGPMRELIAQHPEIGSFYGGIEDLLDTDDRVLDFWSGCNSELLCQLQNAHDDATDDNNWQLQALEACDDVAKIYHLELVPS